MVGKGRRCDNEGPYEADMLDAGIEEVRAMCEKEEPDVLVRLGFSWLLMQRIFGGSANLLFEGASNY